MSLLTLHSPDLIRAAVEVGVREAFAIARRIFGELRGCGRRRDPASRPAAQIEPGGRARRLRPDETGRARSALKGAAADRHADDRRRESKLFELEDAGLIDSVMSGGARLAGSLYKLLIRDVVLSTRMGRRPGRRPCRGPRSRRTTASTAASFAGPGLQPNWTRSRAPICAARRRPPRAAPVRGRRLSELLRASARKEGPPLSRRGRNNEAAQFWINNALYMRRRRRSPVDAVFSGLF